jgi:proline iminopeptidase
VTRRAILLPLAVLAVALLQPTPAHASFARPSGPGKTFTTADSVTIWYEVRGSAPGRPLIVVNGGPGFDHTYVLCSDVWDAMAKRRPVVFYDQRGNGRSSALSKEQSCTLADQIADLEGLRRQLGAERADFLGHSWGGYLVMAYATRYPEHVAHLLIVDSAAPKWTDTDFIFTYIFPEGVERQGRLDFFDALGDSAAGKQSLREYLGMIFLSPEKRDDFLTRADTYLYTRSVNEALNADLAKYDMWPLLPTLTMPTLVITGRYDINVAPSTAWKIHKAIPGSRWMVFERSGHIPYFEEPAEFQRAVESCVGAPENRPGVISCRGGAPRIPRTPSTSPRRRSRPQHTEEGSMITIPSLWVPILISAVFVFILSSIIHMVLPYHRGDFKKLPAEDEIQEALRKFDIPPGDYLLPCAGSPAAMKDPKFVEKMTKGPNIIMTVTKPGPPTMAGSLVLWFLYCIVVSILAAYITGRALMPGAHYLWVFRFAGATAFIAYSIALLQNSIWYRRNWGATLLAMFDGLLYGLVTAGTFGWLWPR